MPNVAYGAHPVRRLRPDPVEVETAAARLAKAQKPVLVAGTGAVQAGAHAAVRALAESLSLPIATSLGGRGIVPTTHALHIGVVGTYSAPITNQLVHEADLVVYVGCHTGDQVTNNWTVRPLSPPSSRSTSMAARWAATIQVSAGLSEIRESRSTNWRQRWVGPKGMVRSIGRVGPMRQRAASMRGGSQWLNFGRHLRRRCALSASATKSARCCPRTPSSSRTPGIQESGQGRCSS